MASRYLVELRGKAVDGACPQCGRPVVYLATRHLSLVCEGSATPRLLALHQCHAVEEASPLAWQRAGRRPPG